MGRPRKWTPKDRARVLQLMEAGLTQRAIASEMKVGLSSLKRHMGPLMQGTRPLTRDNPEWTADQRELVRGMTACGLTRDEIACLMGIGTESLRAAFRQELDTGDVIMDAKVATVLGKMALSGENTAATIFWMKARRHWRDRVAVDHSGKVTQEHTGEIQTRNIRDAVGLLDKDALGQLEGVLDQIDQKTLTEDGPGPADPVN